MTRMTTPTSAPWGTIAREQEHLHATIDALSECATHDRALLLDVLEQDLVLHTQTEEAELYSVLLSVPDAREATRRSLVEHRDLINAVMELRELGVTSNRWNDKVAVLQMRLRRHYERELRELMPIASRALDADQLRLIEARLLDEGLASEEVPPSKAA